MKLRAILMILAVLAAAGIPAMAAAGDPDSSDHSREVQTTDSPDDSADDPADDSVDDSADDSSDDSLDDSSDDSLDDSPDDSLDDSPDDSLDDSEDSGPDDSREGEVERHGISADDLSDDLFEEEQELELEHGNLTADRRRVEESHRNESALVRVLENETYSALLIGAGIGPQISAFARDYNMSLQAQVRAEEQIQSRNAFVRFFLGGDRQAAALLSQASLQNMDRIQQMQQLILQCQDCDPRVKEVLQEQLKQTVEQQTRIQQLAQEEMQDTGLFGWIGR